MRHKFSTEKNVETRFSQTELYKIIADDNIQCAFLDLDICLCIFLTFLVTNCSAERSFPQLKYIDNFNRTAMQQGRLDCLSLVITEANVLLMMSFDDLIKNFATKKVGGSFTNNKKE